MCEVGSVCVNVCVCASLCLQGMMNENQYLATISLETDPVQ